MESGYKAVKQYLDDGSRFCGSKDLQEENEQLRNELEAVKGDRDVYIACIRYLLFDFSVWGSAPWATHVVVLRMLTEYVHSDPHFVKQHVGIRPLLQALVKVYYSEPSEYACKRDASLTEDAVAELQHSVVEMLRMLIDSERVVYRVDVSFLLSVLYMVEEAGILSSLLALIYEQCTQRRGNAAG